MNPNVSGGWANQYNKEWWFYGMTIEVTYTLPGYARKIMGISSASKVMGILPSKVMGV
jgi:hypothetical protein